MTHPELAEALQVVEYRLESLASGYLPGYHKAASYGTAGKLAGFTSLLHRMDPKNIDPVTTRRVFSPVPLVRLYEAKVSLTVAVLVDLSASMGFVGSARKMAEAAKLAACLAYSAYRLGDRTMLVGFGDEFELYYPPRRSPEYALELGMALWDREPTSRGVGALAAACARVPRRRSLVFLISDFHFEPAALEDALARLRQHDVVLVALWDEAEERPVGSGWAELYDPETGARTRRWLRPGLRPRIRRRLEERRVMLEEVARRFGAETLFVRSRFDPVELARFFAAQRV